MSKRLLTEEIFLPSDDRKEEPVGILYSEADRKNASGLGKNAKGDGHSA